MNNIHEKQINFVEAGHFDCFDLTLQNDIRRVARLYHLEPEETLYYQGDPARCFYVVQRGGIRLLEQTDSGRSVSIKIYGQGEVFGLLAVSGEFAHYTDAVAVEESLVIAIEGTAAREIMCRHGAFAVYILDLLVEHIRHAHQRIRHMAVEKVEQRIARALLVHAEKFGAMNNMTITISPISQQDLAEHAGTTVETVNRILKSWVDKALINVSRQRIDIVKYPALMHIAENLAPHYP